MTRRLLTLIFTAMMLAMCPAVANAQNLKFDIVKFELNQLDGTASNKNYEKIDGSGNKYAIIKVRSTDGDEGLGEFMFNFNSLKSIVEDKGDELWVYVQKNAKIVTISREGYTPLRNFDLKMTLQAGKTYNMEITYDRVEKVVKKELRMQMLSFKLTPAVEGAVVMCKEQGTGNETLIGQTNKQGMVSKNLNFGTYEYKILANNYFASEGIVKLNNAKEVYTENITLKSNFSTITLTTNEGADIYVNNELKGRGSWTGPLQAGDYVVECKQQNHRSTSQSITVEANADKTIELQKPTPITGVVSVVSDPLGATVLIDGKERGKTPCNVSDVLVGNRRVALSMSGYATASTSIVVKEGEVTDVNLTLKNTATSNTSAAKANTTATTTTSENEGENNKKYDGEIYSVVEQMPQFPGGMAAMMRWIKENVKYPTVSLENGSQGRAIVSFVVETDGSISNVEIVRSTGDKHLDNEAIRLVKSMPKWAPGKQVGKNVRVKYTAPIMFKLM